MKNNKKNLSKISILLLIFALIVFLTGCGGSAGPSGRSDNSIDGGNNENYVPEEPYNISTNKSRDAEENGDSMNFYNENDSIIEPEPEPTIDPDDSSNEKYKDYGVNPEIDTTEENFSTFSVDVDTGSYAVARRFMFDNRRLPPQESVRAEEFINYFDYNYILPKESIFGIQTDVAPSPFREGKHFLRIGIQGKDVSEDERKQANLIFLIDVSGSMRSKNKLPLVKESMKMLLDELKSDDYVGIAVYAGNAQPYLVSTPVKNKRKIVKAINKLDAGGSTNAQGGLKVAYEMLSENYLENGVNRVILCSDGDANVGNVSPEQILELVDNYQGLGFTLSTFGFGMGNYNDYFMEQLANQGNGNYGYIDSINEAERVFVKNFISIIQEIARDVKVQIEFNPDTVKAYRLVGYENRHLEKEEFRDDTVDAGEIGAKHSVTAVYELTLQEGYQNRGENLYTFYIRWKTKEGQDAVEDNTVYSVEKVRNDFDEASPYFRIAVSVAEFAEVLRGSPYAENTSLNHIHEIVLNALNELRDNKLASDDKFNELLELIDIADRMMEEKPAS